MSIYLEGKTARMIDGLNNCALCMSSKDDPLDLGDFCTDGTINAHYYCLLLSSGLVQGGEDDEGLMGFLPKDIKKEAARVRDLKCFYCLKKHANIGCCHIKCRRTFHTLCGIKNSCMSRMMDTFQSFCNDHVPKNSKYHDRKETCGICLENMGNYNRVSSVRPTCCKKWFHLVCLKKNALSAGYFFKCPLCNDKDTFRNYVINRGVFVPDRDALWESEPNAFAELLQRSLTCMAATCICTNGRDFNEGDHEVTYCNSCGSTCVHDQCWTEEYPFVCEDCKTIPAVIDTVINSFRIVENQATETSIRDASQQTGGDNEIDIVNLDVEETDDDVIITGTEAVDSQKTPTNNRESDSDKNSNQHTASDTDSEVVIRTSKHVRQPIVDEDSNQVESIKSDSDSDIIIKTLITKKSSRSVIDDDSDSEIVNTNSQSSQAAQKSVKRTERGSNGRLRPRKPQPQSSDFSIDESLGSSESSLENLRYQQALKNSSNDEDDTNQQSNKKILRTTRNSVQRTKYIEKRELSSDSDSHCGKLNRKRRRSVHRQISNVDNDSEESSDDDIQLSKYVLKMAEKRNPAKAIPSNTNGVRQLRQRKCKKSSTITVSSSSDESTDDDVPISVKASKLQSNAISKPGKCIEKDENNTQDTCRSNSIIPKSSNETVYRRPRL